MSKGKGDKLEEGLFQYFKNGYFDISFPDIFKINFNKKIDFNFSEFNLKKYKNVISKTKPYYFLEIDKGKVRTKSIAHIVPYINFFKFLYSEKNFLKKEENNLIGTKFPKSNYSYKNESILFSYYGDYPIFSTNIKFSENKYKEIKKYKKIYIESQKLNTKNKIEKKIDVINFFPSIYTHKIYKNLNNELNKKNQNEKFDENFRLLNNNESNGALIGPVTSLFFTEIVLNQVSFLLLRENLIFRRFCDDFSFYFKNEKEYEESIFKIWKIFNKFNLNVKEKNKNKDIGILSKHINEIIGRKKIEQILIEINSMFIDEVNKEKYIWNGNYIISKIIKSEKKVNWKINENSNELKKIIKNFIEFPKLSNNIFVLIKKIIEKNEDVKSFFIEELRKFEINALFKSRQETKIIWFYFAKFNLESDIKIEEINKIIKQCINHNFYITASMICFILKNNLNFNISIKDLKKFWESKEIEIDILKTEQIIFYLEFKEILNIRQKNITGGNKKILNFLEITNFSFFTFTNELRLNVSSY